MTRTRSQAAQAPEGEGEGRKTSATKDEGRRNNIVLDFGVAPPSKKISK